MHTKKSTILARALLNTMQAQRPTNTRANPFDDISEPLIPISAHLAPQDSDFPDAPSFSPRHSHSNEQRQASAAASAVAPAAEPDISVPFAYGVSAVPDCYDNLRERESVHQQQQQSVDDRRTYATAPTLSSQFNNSNTPQHYSRSFDDEEQHSNYQELLDDHVESMRLTEASGGVITAAMRRKLEGLASQRKREEAQAVKFASKSASGIARREKEAFKLANNNAKQRHREGLNASKRSNDYTIVNDEGSYDIVRAGKEHDAYVEFAQNVESQEEKEDEKKKPSSGYTVHEYKTEEYETEDYSDGYEYKSEYNV
jgi:hypothetical protein